MMPSSWCSVGVPLVLALWLQSKNASAFTFRPGGDIRTLRNAFPRRSREPFESRQQDAFLLTPRRGQPPRRRYRGGKDVSSLRTCAMKLATSKEGLGDIAGEGGDSAVDVTEYTPWPAINRKVVGGLASVGAFESAFLTFQKLNPGGLDRLCGASGGCADVLNGPYSSILGVPLSTFGMLGYLMVAGFAIVPLVWEDEAVEKTTRSLLLMMTTAMGLFSVYLLGLLKFKIGYPCPWCITSAGLSLAMCAVAWLRRAVPEKTKAVVMGVCTSLVTAFACLTIFVVTETALDIRQAEAAPGEIVGVELIAAPAIDTESSPQALRIAKKLKSLNAKMYGAYWCTHCFHQKELLGKQAMATVKYVECSSRGVDNQVELCRAADIPGFPTWDIDGKLYPGEQTLEELEEIVGLAPYNG